MQRIKDDVRAELFGFLLSEKISKVESLLDFPESSSKKEIDPVADYRKICSILSEGKKL